MRSDAIGGVKASKICENTCKSFQIDPRLILSGGGIHTFREAIAALREHFKREDPDVIHMHGRALWPVAKALRLLRILPPCITTVHQEPERSLYIVDRLAGRLFCSDRVIAISSDMKKPLSQKMGIPVGRIDVVPHGVNVTYFRPPSDDEKRAARARFNLPETGPVACYLGRFSTYKGIDTVIKGIAEAVKECPTLRMIIAGEGHEQPTLERLVEELNLRDNIDFLGRQSPPFAGQLILSCLAARAKASHFRSWKPWLVVSSRCALRARGRQIKSSTESTDTSFRSGISKPSVNSSLSFARTSSFAKSWRKARCILHEIGSPVRPWGRRQ
jgi:glycosyltransferase involved in cell wall biosynthesis